MTPTPEQRRTLIDRLFQGKLSHEEKEQIKTFDGRIAPYHRNFDISMIDFLTIEFKDGSSVKRYRILVDADMVKVHDMVEQNINPNEQTTITYPYKIFNNL